MATQLKKARALVRGGIAAGGILMTFLSILFPTSGKTDADGTALKNVASNFSFVFTPINVAHADYVVAPTGK